MAEVGGNGAGKAGRQSLDLFFASMKCCMPLVRSLHHAAAIEDGWYAFRGLTEEEMHPDTKRLLAKKGYLLITAGHNISTVRLTSVACIDTYVGSGLMPVSGGGGVVAPLPPGMVSNIGARFERDPGKSGRG